MSSLWYPTELVILNEAGSFNVGKLFGYKTRIGATIHLGVLGWITILSQLGIISIDPLWHNGLIIFMGGQMIVFASLLMSGFFRGGNPKIRCQNCNASMEAVSYKCKICGSEFKFGGTKE